MAFCRLPHRPFCVSADRNRAQPDDGTRALASAIIAMCGTVSTDSPMKMIDARSESSWMSVRNSTADAISAAESSANRKNR